MPRGGIKENLLGQTFNRLTVIAPAESIVKPNGRVRTRWLCRCSCGTELIVKSEHLKSGNTKSCGCYQAEVRRTATHKCRKPNAYVIRDNYVIFYTSKNEPFLVDIEDFGRVRKHCWYKNGLGYLKAKINSKSVFLHRFILNTTAPTVDHKNGSNSVWDNRRQNLREVTQKENTQNSAVRSDNATGITGVCSYKDKWMAYIHVDGKQIRLGYYDDINDAIDARHKAEDKYFGEFSYRNSREK